MGDAGSSGPERRRQATKVTRGWQLETERLWLRAWQESDLADFRPIATDPDVIRYIGDGTPWDDERIRDFIGRQISSQRRNGFCLWQLVPKDGGGLIGFCGLQPWRQSGEIEIGWWLAKEHWKKGLATEAARACLRHGFENAQLKRIIAVVLKPNQASRRVAEKLGMAVEKTTLCEGQEALIYAIEKT